MASTGPHPLTLGATRPSTEKPLTTWPYKYHSVKGCFSRLFCLLSFTTMLAVRPFSCRPDQRCSSSAANSSVYGRQERRVEEIWPWRMNSNRGY